MRDDLHFKESDTLESASKSEELAHRSAISMSHLKKDRGVWVFHGDGELTSAKTLEVLEQIRSRRDYDNLVTK